jgi:hypothetical protein
MHPLTLPAPHRCSEETPEGYFTRPWAAADVRAYRAIGGWFSPGLHHFADRAAAHAAFGDLPFSEVSNVNA